MAGDWIKMRTDLYRDPKVIVIADLLMQTESPLSAYVSQQNQCDMSVTRNVMRNVTVGALVSVWGVARHQGKRIDDDLVLKNVTVSVIDDIADLSGFGDAMVECGWLSESAQGLVFPKFFEEHNVDPLDDQRAKNRDRQRRYRNKKRNVTVTSQCHAREEKSREENNTPLKPPKGGGSRKQNVVKAEDCEYPPRLDTPEVRTAIGEWLEHKTTINSRYRLVNSVNKLLKQWASRAGPAQFVELIDVAIANNWKGIHESNSNTTAQGRAERTEQANADVFEDFMREG